MTVLLPRQTTLGDLPIRRFLPHSDVPMVGPFIFFDHFGPVVFEPGQGIDVRPHPHIGLATLSYLFEGAILHRDSLGFVQSITPGDVNLMVAGCGVTHSERESEAVRKACHRLHGVQIWLALPDGQEDIPPDFYHYPAASLPGVSLPGAEVTVVMGRWGAGVSPVKQHAPTCLYDVRATTDTQVTVPIMEGFAYGLMVVHGQVHWGDTVLQGPAMATVDATALASINLGAQSRVLVLGGAPFSTPRYLFWNFVASAPARLEQAKADWQAGRFPLIPNDCDERLTF